MNALATVIASYALRVDSTSGVIGAMLEAMPAGGSLALADGDSLWFRQSLLSLGCGIVILCALGVGLLHPDIPAGKELLGRTHPNYPDLMIALTGGAVGAYLLAIANIVAIQFSSSIM